MLGDTGWGERIPERYAPYVGHIRPDVAALMDGSYMSIVHMRGRPYELASHAERDSRAAMMNTLLRYIADPAILIHAHLVRWRDDRDIPDLARAPGFGLDLSTAYRNLLRGKLWRNDWFLTVIVRPDAPGTRTLRRARNERAQPKVNLDPDMLMQLDDAVLAIEATLDAYGPRRLAYRDVPPADDPEAEPNRYSEIAEALYLMRTAHWIAQPEIVGTLGGSIVDENVTVGPRRLAFDLELPGLPRVGTALGLKHYMSKTHAGMLNSLLSANYPLVLHQSFHFRDRIISTNAMQTKLQQMENAGDKAETQKKILTAAMDAVASNEEATGMHNFGLLVFAEDIHALGRVVADARKRVSEFGGAKVTRERRGLEGAYWSVMPGVVEFRMRKGKISTIDFANLCSFETYPQGQTQGHWGPAIKRMPTNGGNAWNFVPHVGEIAHTVLTGWSGSGKTTFMGDIAASIEPIMGPGGLRIMVDKDESNRLTIEMCGGRYAKFRRNRPSGVAPLLWADTPENQGALLRILKGRIEHDGRGIITRDEEHRLARGIRRQFKLPPEKRTMGGVREFLGYSDDNGAGARFENYCRGGAMGWLLDNDEHLISLDTDAVPSGFFGYDFTELLPKAEDLSDDDGCCATVAAILIHEMRQKMDGRRIAFFGDEARFYLNPIGSVFEDLALTGRKLEVMMWLAMQHPSHILSHPLGPSIIGQCPTKISFPDPNADASYVTGLGYSPAALRKIKGDMGLRGGRRMMVWRDGEPVILEYDLSALPDQLAILSGRPRTVQLHERVKTDLVSANHVERYQEFTRRNRLSREAIAA